MNKEELIRNLKYTMEKHKNDFVPTFGTNIFLMCQDILDYLEGEPCEDAVSRQEALNLFNNSDEYGWEMSLLKNKIKNLPPVKPIAFITEINFSKEDMQEMVNEKIKETVKERKKGKWIKKENIHGLETYYKCSNCGERCLYEYIEIGFQNIRTNFCPNCGAEMQEEE